MSDDEEKYGPQEFLSRWSRLKQQAREQSPDSPQPAPPAIDPRAPPPELPPVDQLDINSDFRGFFHPKVDENLRRAALKKLFSDPRFNVMDGLDVYVDDYSQPNPLPAVMLAQLKQAQKILNWAKQTDQEAEARRAGVSAENVTLPVDERIAAPAIAAEPAVAELSADANQRVEVEAQSADGRKT